MGLFFLTSDHQQQYNIFIPMALLTNYLINYLRHPYPTLSVDTDEVKIRSIVIPSAWDW